jgi:energy-coupling factor transport system permease protein
LGLHRESRKRRRLRKIFFQEVHPLGSFLYYTGFVLFLTLFFHPVYLFISLLVLVFVNIIHGNMDKLLKSFPFLILMAILIIIINPFLNQRGTHLLFYIFNEPIMLEGVVYGVLLALSLINIITLFYSYQVIIDHKRFLFLFGRAFPQSSLLILLTLRFIPLLKRRLNEIMIVQKRRGIVMNNVPFKERVMRGFSYVQTLLTWSLEEAIQTADSMAARGYGFKTRSSYEHFTWKKSDFMFMFILSALFFIPILGLIVKSYGRLTVYPELQYSSIKPEEYVHIFLFTLYLLLPLLIEGREWLKWKK